MSPTFVVLGAAVVASAIDARSAVAFAVGMTDAISPVRIPCTHCLTKAICVFESATSE